jgi:hypothetical protein
LDSWTDTAMSFITLGSSRERVFPQKRFGATTKQDTTPIQ